MVYPYLTLDDNTEIVHSEMFTDGRVKVYIEKAVYDGFHHATCYLPKYEWQDIYGFSNEEMDFFKKLIINNTHAILESSQKERNIRRKKTP